MTTTDIANVINEKQYRCWLPLSSSGASYRLSTCFRIAQPNPATLRWRGTSRPWGGSLRWLWGWVAVSARPEMNAKGRVRRGRQATPRRVYQQVKLTEEERDQLRARAAELGMSVPRLMVESAVSGASWTPTEQKRMLAELFETRRLLATVANNVNQLARAANISGQVSEGQRLEKTLADVDELVAQLRRMTGVRR